MSEGIDVEATEAKLRVYERANFADIAAKEARKVPPRLLCFYAQPDPPLPRVCEIPTSHGTGLDCLGRSG